MPLPEPLTDELYAQVFEANFADFESVRSVQDIPGPRTDRLLAHILETKRMYWALIARACGLASPPDTLEDVMAYELEQVRGLDAGQRASELMYGEQRMTVAALVRLAARHSVWHAGQIALTRLD